MKVKKPNRNFLTIPITLLLFILPLIINNQIPSLNFNNKQKNNNISLSSKSLTKNPKEAIKENLKKLKPGKDYVADQVVVGFKKGVSKRKIASVSKKLNLKIKSKIPQLNVYTLIIPKGRTVPQVINTLSKSVDVKYAEPNGIVRASVVPNDPYYSSSGSWGQSYDDLWGLKKIQTDQAWDVSTGSNSVVVAVIDTGLDFTHEDIQGNIWSNPGEVGNGKETNGIDDDGNGYIDDYRGWDFYHVDNDPTDDHGHGTHVSGTVGAAGNNGIGVVGVNWNVKIMPVKFLGETGNGNDVDATEALLYAADNGAIVLNNSWGGDNHSQIISDAIAYAHNKGLTIVVSAGNSNDDAMNYSPSDDPNAITVAATDYQDQKASFSNWGSKIDVAAPGVNVLSLRAAGTDIYGDGSHTVGSKYIYVNGTSMAAPHVSGLAALILSVNPSLTNEEIRQVLRESSDDLGSQGRDDYFGYGRINASNTLRNPLMSNWITNLQPSSYSCTSNNTPMISASFTNNIVENPSTIQLKLDGQVVSHIYDSNTREVSYQVVSALSNGHHETELSLQDTSGVSKNVKWNFYVDTQTPSKPLNLTADSKITLNWQASSDNFGIKEYEIERSEDGFIFTKIGSSTTTTYSDLALNLPGDLYYYRVRAVDTVFNVSNYSDVVQVIPDKAPPSTTAAVSGTSGSNDWYTSNVNVTLSAIDDLSGVNVVKYKINNGTWNTYSSPVKLTIEGTNTFYYYAVDNIGNIEQTKTTIIKLDKTAPDGNITINNDDVNAYSRNVIINLSQVTDSASGLDKVMLSEDNTFSGATWQNYATMLPFTLSSGFGDKTVYAQLKDKAGNVSVNGTFSDSFNTATYNDTVNTTANWDTLKGQISLPSDLWAAISTTGVPSARSDHTAIWTGSKMIVWGGYGSSSGYTNTGGIYDPATDTWSATSTTNAPSAREWHTAVWTGTKMIVWGGSNNAGLENSGGIYDPITDTWTTMSTIDAPSARDSQTAVWTGSKMIVWGGYGSSDYLNSGGIYDPATDTWITMSTTDSPSARYVHTAVWTGTKMIVWGGFSNNGLENTGGIYDPAVDTWTTMPTTGAPLSRCFHAAVWTGTKMIVWGGFSNNGLENTGGIYNLATNTWTAATSTMNAPLARYGHTAVWTGSNMIIWGGVGNGYLNSGGIISNNDIYQLSARAQSLTVDITTRPIIKATLNATQTLNGQSVNYQLSRDGGQVFEDVQNGVEHTFASTNSEKSDLRWRAILSSSDNLKTPVIDDVSIDYLSDLISDRITLQPDTVAPITASSISGTIGDNGWYKSNVDLTLSASDDLSGAKETYYRINSGAWDLYISPVSILTEGTNIVDYYSVDNAENIELSKTEIIKIDKTEPLGNMSINNGDNYTDTANVTINLSQATDSTSGLDKVMLSEDKTFSGATWQNYATTLPFTLSSSGGEKTVYAQFMDIAGNVSLANRVFSDSFNTVIYKDIVNTTADWDTLTGQIKLSTSSTNAWIGTTSSTGVPSARGYHTAVWTGSKMIVWGGYGSSNFLNSGGIYDPSTNSWTSMSTTNAPLARDYHTAVWTGSKMIVWGGYGSSGYLNSGGIYDPSANTWTAMSTAYAPSSRRLHTAVWTGSKMIVWGGYGSSSSYSNEGGIYDPATGTWTATSTTNAPSARDRHTAVWTGSKMIVWGGYDFSGNLNSGGIYNPVSDTWSTMSSTNAPLARQEHTAVWTGAKMIVWGGFVSGSSYLNSGGIYDHVTDTWTATSTTNAPSARKEHTAVWAGTKMIVWGGYDSAYLNSGGIFSFAFQPASTAQSSTVDSTLKPIIKATLNANQTLNGQPVNYQLSRDGGQTWEDAQVGVEHMFTSTNLENSDLRFRALLNSSDNTKTPVIDDISIDYYSDPSSDQIILRDTIAPTTIDSLTGISGSNGWYTSDVGVTLSATDDSSGIKETKYRLNGGAWNTYSTPLNIIAEGTTTLDYYSVDNANNTETTKTSTIKIDKTNPSIPSNLTVTLQGSNQADLSWSPSTDSLSGVKDYDIERSFDGINFTKISISTGSTYSDTGLSLITYYYRLRVNDNASNVSDYSNVVSVTVGFTFTDTFNTTTYNDTINTTANWDTILGDIKLPSGGGGSASWTNKAPLLATVYIGGALTYSSTNNKIYAFTGNNKNTFLEYDTSSNTWTTKAPAPANIYNGGALTSANGKIYGLRGVNTTSFYEYDIASNTWITKASTPASIYNGGALAYNPDNNKIYAFRGYNSKIFYEYNIATNTWATKASTPANVNTGGAMVYANGKIYGLSGNNTTSFYEYDPITNTWAMKASIPVNVNGGGALTYKSTNNKIYALSGNNTNNFLEYDIPTNTWTTKEATPSAVNGAGALAYDSANNSIYGFSGNNTTNFFSYVGSNPIYQSPKTVQSTTIDATTDIITKATLAATEQLNGQTIIYQLSRDGGLIFEDITPGVGHIFTSLSTEQSDLRWRAVLVTNNSSQTPIINDITISYTSNAPADITAPSTTVSLTGTSGSNGWYTSDVGLTLSATDDSSGVSETKFRFNGGAWNTYSTPLNIISDGSTTVDYYSIDNLNNTEATKTQTINIDKTLPVNPTLLSTSHTIGQISYDKTVDVSISGATDTPSLVDGFSYEWSQSPSTDPDTIKDDEETLSSTTSPTLADGSWYLHLRTVDNAGNWSETTHLGPFVIINQAPVLDVIGNKTIDEGSALSFILNATDTNGDTLTYSASNLPTGATFDPETRIFSWTPTSTQSGIYPNVRFEVSDGNGGVDFEDVTITVTDVDVIAPSTTDALTGILGTNNWYTSDVEVTLSATDDLSGVSETNYRFNSGAWNTYSAPLSILTDGTTTLDYYSVDNANNTETTKTSTIKIDKTPPIQPVSLSATPQGDSQINLSWIASADTTSGVKDYDIERSTDGINFTNVAATTETTYSDTGLTPGTYYYRLIATDNASNTSDYSNIASATLTMPDTTAPATTVSLTGTLGTNNWYTTDVGVTLSATDDSSGIKETKYRLNGGAWNIYSAPLNITTEGTTTVDYYSVDNANNTETIKASTIKIDKTNPSIPVNLTATLQGSNQADLVWSASMDSASGIKDYDIERSSDGVNFTEIATSTGTTYSDAGLASGTYYYRLKANDNASNVSDYSNVVSVTVASNESLTFTDTFNTTTYDDTINTTANWDTILGDIKLPSGGGGSASWTNKASMLTTVYTGGALTYNSTNNKIYAFTGNNKNTFLEYDTSSNSWTTKAPAPANIYNGGALTSANGKIYGLRGVNTKYFYEYDISANTWTTKALTPNTIYNGGALAYNPDNNKIYAFRGYNSKEFYQYDIATNTWTTRASAPVNINTGGAMVYANGKIYGLAGNNTTSFYEYDPITNTWTMKASTPVNVNGGGALTFNSTNNKIYALSGNNTNTFLEYDFPTNTWITKEPTPSAVNGAGALAYDSANNSIYGFSGNNTTNFFSYTGSTLSYQSPKTAQSTTIDTTLGTITKATLTATQTLNGQSIVYQLSRDGGQSWEDITPGVEHTFISANTEQSDLRWRATLSTSDGQVTPIIEDVTVSYTAEL